MSDIPFHEGQLVLTLGTRSPALVLRVSSDYVLVRRCVDGELVTLRPQWLESIGPANEEEP